MEAIEGHEIEGVLAEGGHLELRCECGFAVNLGETFSSADITTLAKRHWRSVQSQPKPEGSEIMKAIEGHEIELVYTRDESGLHLWCQCGFDENLGHSVSPGRAMAAAEEHWRSVQSQPKPDGGAE